MGIGIHHQDPSQPFDPSYFNYINVFNINFQYIKIQHLYNYSTKNCLHVNYLTLFCTMSAVYKSD
jgi:hypothetical protein